MFETMGHALIQTVEGQRQIGESLMNSLAKAWRRAADILARQARLGGFMQ